MQHQETGNGERQSQGAQAVWLHRIIRPPNVDYTVKRPKSTKISALVSIRSGWQIARRGWNNCGCGQMSGQKEEEGVGGNVEVKIDQTVYQKGTTAEESGKVKRGGKGLVDL